jgi:nitrogen fixation/metabolism regulation signal transduction histidine kinase
MASTARTSSRPRHQRRLRNYLLDSRFQLKYATYVALVALLIGVVSGLLLWKVSEASFNESTAKAQLSKEVLAESRKVSEVVRMNLIKDPEYGNNPLLREAFEADAKAELEKYERQQQELEEHVRRLDSQRREFAILLICALVALVVALWLAGIVVTHKVAGPIFKMKRQLRALENGNFEVPSPLRRGDELKDFFDAFNDMVRALRKRQEGEIELLDSAISKLEAGSSGEKLEPLRELRQQMLDSLDTRD